MAGAQSKPFGFVPLGAETSGPLGLVGLGAELVINHALSSLSWRCSRLTRVALPCPELAEVI